MTIGNGTCGASATWRLEDDGTLYIEGTGAMTDYASKSEQPWYNQEIKRIIIAEGITRVGSYAFYECSLKYENKDLTPNYVLVPDSVVSIGSLAFYRTRLALFIIGTGVDTLENGCFSNLGYAYGAVLIFKGNAPSNIVSVGLNNETAVISNGWANTSTLGGYSYQYHTFNIGDNITWDYDLDTLTLTISGEGEMYDLDSTSHIFYRFHYNIQKVVIDDRISKIGAYALYSCSNISSIEGGVGLKKVGNYAFQGCAGLLDHLSDLEEIGVWSFASCKYTKLDLSNAKSIGESAFRQCTAVEKLILNDNLTEIEPYTFYN